MLYGLTLEETSNHALDGGLYGELLQNRDMTTLTGTRQGTKVTIWPESWMLDKGLGAEAEIDGGGAHDGAGDGCARARSGWQLLSRFRKGGMREWRIPGIGEYR